MPSYRTSLFALSYLLTIAVVVRNSPSLLNTKRQLKAPPPSTFGTTSLMRQIAASFWNMNSETGKMQLPASVRNVMIDIGARESDYLKALRATEDNETALFLFDPLPDSYIPIANGASEFGMRHAKNPWLDPLRSNQVFAARVAVGETEGTMDFNVGSGPACSSMLRASANNTFWCANAKRTIETNVVTLKSFLELIPESQIEQIHLKVDAEGADLMILRGAGNLLEKFTTIVIECLADDANEQHYDGQCMESEAAKYMSSRGFDVRTKGQGTLVNMFFTNQNQKQQPLPSFLRAPQLTFRHFYEQEGKERLQ